MLAIINKFNDDEVTPMMLDDDAWFVTHAFNGNDELQFTFSEESGYYNLLEEESKVLAIGLRGRSNRFVVKNIDSHDGIVTVDCSIDLYDWQQTIFDTYGGGKARTLEKVLQDVTPSGWSYSGQEQFVQSEIFQTGSREPVKAGTPLDVLDLASEVYGCVFNFDNIANHLYVIDTESYTPSGDFLSDEVNLKSLGYVGNSEGYATRLYPYGKRDDNGENPVTIESVNEGLPYVTNNEFSDDIICVGWSDERYTDPKHLKEAAIARLTEIAVPTRSYECDVSQLNRNVWLYMVLTMIDRKHRTRVDQQVVEWKEYGRPDLDVVTLSAVVPSLESLLKSADADDDAIYQYVNGIASDLTNAYEDAIKNATDKITGNNGGYFQWIFDAEGRPVELVNLGDSKDINNAQKVWRWNQNGLGHSNDGYNGSYGLALLADGSINASMMTVGIIQGGQSYWNLNTGDIDIVGTFQTRADSEMDQSNTLYGIKLSPEFSQIENSGDDRMYGAGMVFDGDSSGREILPYIASEMYSEEEGMISAVDIVSGRVAVDDPGSFIRLGNRNNGGSSGNAPKADCYVAAYGQYNASGNQDYSYFEAEATKVGNNASQGLVRSRLIARSTNGSGHGDVGVSALARDSNGTLDNYLYLGGFLGTLDNLGPLQICYWENISINAYTVATYSATLSAPARAGRYKAFATVDMTMTTSDMHGIWCTVGNAGASGWTVYVFTPPDFIYAKRSSGDAWGSFKLWNGASKPYYLNSFGFLVSN